MRVLFLRHGETDWNRAHRIQGSTAWTALTPFGVQLAEMTRDGMVKAGCRFDRIYTSPYRRAVQTAEIVSSAFGLTPIADDRLREMSFGRYEGTLIGDGSFADDNIRACFRDPERYVARDGAESFDAVAARVRDFFENELAPLEATCRSVLVVAHGSMMRSVRRVLTNVPMADYWRGRQPNCCAHEIEVSGGRFTLVDEARVFYDPKLAASVLSV